MWYIKFGLQLLYVSESYENSTQRCKEDWLLVDLNKEAPIFHPLLAWNLFRNAEKEL